MYAAALAVVLIVCFVMHRHLVRSQKELVSLLRNEVRENRLLIKEIRNSARTELLRAEKRMFAQLDDLGQNLESIRTEVEATERSERVASSPASSTDKRKIRFEMPSPLLRISQAFVPGRKIRAGTYLSRGSAFLKGKLPQNKVEDSVVEEKPGNEGHDISGKLNGRPVYRKPGLRSADDVESNSRNSTDWIRAFSDTPRSGVNGSSLLSQSKGTTRTAKQTLQTAKVHVQSAVAKELPFKDEQAFQQLTERVRSWHLPEEGRKSRPRVLMVTSNGAGLGHLTRISAVERWLDADTLIYTMSSAYHRLGKSNKEIMYFPSHGDLGMSGKQWNQFMESNFSAVVEGFRPDAIVFDGTYIYRGVVSTSKKTGIPLTWVQRGCWKADVDERSKQRHQAASFCDHVIVPGDYGCREEVDLGQGIEPIYVPPVTLNAQSDLMDKEEARKALGLPTDKKLFLVQLGAGVINDIADLRTTVVRAVQNLGSDWEPVLVRNPLSSHDKLSEVLSIQAYPLGIYYNAFEAGAFAAGYNTVQESVELLLPGLFVPNLSTKTDDQLRRATDLADAGLCLTATGRTEIETAVRQLGSSDVRARIIGEMKRQNQGSGAKEAATVIESQFVAAG